VEDAPAPVAEKAADVDKSTGATSFLQLRGAASGPIGKKVLDFITEKASLLQSPILSTLALKLKLGTAKDHFVKVRTMIKDLIAKLEADAEAEASQKAFCDEEMEKATTARDEAIGSVEESTAAIDEAESKIAKLTEEIATLSKEIGDLRKSLFEATELRAKEKAENEKTLADSEAGLEAVKNAISVLKDFYDNAFVQVQFVPKNAGRDGKTVDDLAPGGPSGEYNGNQDAAKGIFGLLEVIQSDFERTIETVTKEEEDAQAEFEAYEKETNDSIEEKGKSKKDKETEKEDTEADLVGFKEDLKTAQEKLADAKEELEKLKPLCVDTGMSWKERRARQKQEIEALKQALAILEDWKS
jgi:chromosome segregation ATPase